MGETTLVPGKKLAAEVEARLTAAVAAAGAAPTLAVVQARERPEAAAYTRSLARAGARVGVAVHAHEPAPDAAAAAQLIAALNADAAVHGVILQKPFLEREADADLAELIAVAKDVDGQTSASLGLLWAGRPGFVPSTAAAALYILEHYAVPLAGAEVVVVGRSPVVGKPAAALCVARHATVTICHTRTRDLAACCRRANVLIVAAGKAGLIRGDMVRPGAAVVDCGYNVGADGTVSGDVAADEVMGVAALLTPAQGGVGPVTTALLLGAVARAAGVGGEL
jgi:methylenetetrahydrofolate dehydrogenase (NADP+)/methenyltetrahydrofolate cyclohydrolase